MKLETLKFDNVFNIQDKNRRILVTKNLSPGKAFFKERLFNVDDIEYREFNPTRSKLAASIVKKISFMPIKKDI